MEIIKDYVIKTVMDNIKENIKLYYNNNNDYFKDIKAIVEIIDESDEYLDYFEENQEPLMILTESTLIDISKLPYIYDLRDGI